MRGTLTFRFGQRLPMELEAISNITRPGIPAPVLPSTLSTLLYGDATEEVEVPPLADLVGALIGLSSGRQQKALLPLVDAPLEVAIVRRGDDALVSLYETGSVPEVIILDHRVSLRSLLDTCAEHLHQDAVMRGRNTAGEVLARLADRAEATAISRLGGRGPRLVERTGGALSEPPEDVCLSFGFRARIPSGGVAGADGASRADVHALLFRGELWAWARGHRHVLAEGPIVPAIARMVTAVRMLVDAWDGDRAANVRLNSGNFTIGVRFEDDVTLTLGRKDRPFTLPALDVSQAALPILRLASDVIRAMVATDRSQTRNLKVRSLREEVRALRRRIRARRRDDGFVNADADRLRAAESRNHHPASAPPPMLPAPTGKLRLTERWGADVDELDATSTFFCGDRLVVATPRRAVALSRDDGAVLWVREGIGGSTHMAGQVMVRISSDSEVELCNVGDGETFATTRIAPYHGVRRAIFVGGGPVPPTVVLPDGPGRLVAVDLRNGEHRFDYAKKGAGALRVTRAGRVLLVASGDGTLDALDAAAGEVIWRHSDGSRFCFEPIVIGETVIGVSGEPGGRTGQLIGLDLYSGAVHFRVELPAAPSAAPIRAGQRAVIAIGGKRRGSIACVDVSDGSLSWMTSDPGLGVGGASLAVDDVFITNTPSGKVTALDLGDGSVRWTLQLSDPVADDVPRRLEPVLRGGALFIPSASVHIVRPADGQPLGAALPCDLVPDVIRVDERGWVYVGEESGQLSAYAPVPHLSLVR